MKRYLKSLRECIDALAEIGEVQPIDQEFDSNLEFGTIARRWYEGAPAPLFNTIKARHQMTAAIAYPSAVPLAMPILKHCRTAFYRIGKLTALSDELISIDVKH